jgi:hypothetical protein
MRSVFARLWCLLGICLVAGTSARAEVRDQDQLFSKDAIVKADEQIAEIRRTYHRQIVIQTTTELPAQYHHKDMGGIIPYPPHMDRYARDLLAKADPPVDGLFVLVYVSKDQTQIHAFALVHPEEAHRDAFTPKNCTDLSRKFEKTAKPGRTVSRADLDKALLELVAQAQADLVENTPPPTPQSVGWTGIAWLLGGGLLLLAFLLLLGSYLRKRSPPATAAESGLATTPEATPALLGNMLGGQATHWVTDPAFRPAEGGPEKQPPPAPGKGNG